MSWYNHTYWRYLASEERNGTIDRLFLLFLVPFSLAYSLILRLRARLYGSGILKIHRLPRPVVSVGNITVGGTGKTPVVSYIARFLLSEGFRVVVLSRGYGGSLEGHTAIVSDGATIMMSASECGDEPYLLASTVPGLMLVVGTDRFAAGMLAMQQLHPDLFLLDDGFQHQRLQRDLNILLLDYANPGGNGWTLPAGLLREPLSAAKRADLVIFTRCPNGVVNSSWAAGRPSCFSRHQITDFVPLQGGISTSASSIAKKRVLAFAGIADPPRFFEALYANGLNIVRVISLPDHAAYTPTCIERLAANLRECSAELLITTEKDGVKLKNLSPDFTDKIMLARLELVIDNPALLADAICNLLQK